mgnify:FL=1
MFEKVRDMLAEALNISADKITLESNVIEDLGADSLDMVELLSRLEDEEGVSIPEEDLDGMTTVGDIVRELEKIIK